MATLDDGAYHGRDLYSDGPVEDDILALVRAGTPVEEVLRRDDRWPVLYHLSPQRRNLLEWYPFRPQGRLLEVGAGCGALTGLFCERLSEVLAVELSRRRSRIIWERWQQLENLRVWVGNIRDLPPDDGFDYITLIGVLEYAGAFMEHPRPHLELLSSLARRLRPGGVLLLALENRFGLKYFAGAAEDHTGRLFEGIEGYPAGGRAMTFSRDALDGLLARAGFARRDFYYPCPDYKLPVEVFSDACLPRAGQGMPAAPNYDHERLRILNEPRTWQAIIAAGHFPFFANSFLVAAAAEAAGQ